MRFSLLYTHVVRQYRRRFGHPECALVQQQVLLLPPIEIEPLFVLNYVLAPRLAHPEAAAKGSEILTWKRRFYNVTEE